MVNFLIITQKDEFKEQRSQPVNQIEKQRFLEEFYTKENGFKTEPTGIDISLYPGSLNQEEINKNLGIVAAQVSHVANAMAGFGFAHFGELVSKFKEKPQTPNAISQLNQIKECMESIFFVVTEIEEKRSLLWAFQDKEFLCLEGTLSNLNAIYTNLTIGKQSLNKLIALAKRELIEKLIIESQEQFRELSTAKYFDPLVRHLF